MGRSVGACNAFDERMGECINSSVNGGDNIGVVVVERTVRKSSWWEEIGCKRGLSGDG